MLTDNTNHLLNTALQTIIEDIKNVVSFSYNSL